MTENKGRQQNISLPIITIITVVRNCERTVENTLLSIINQNYPNIEFIIIDGASTDNTKVIIRKYEKFINFWSSEPDNGIYDAMNKGIANAKGEWIIFMNSGDLFVNDDVLKNIFETTIAANIQIIYGHTILKYAHIEKIQKNEDILKMQKQKGIIIINHQSTIIRRMAFQQIGKYDLRFKITADNHWLNRAIKHFGLDSLYYINFPIAIFDKTEGLSSDRSNHLKVIKEFIIISKEIDGSLKHQLKIGIKGYLKSLYYWFKHETFFR